MRFGKLDDEIFSDDDRIYNRNKQLNKVFKNERYLIRQHITIYTFTRKISFSSIGQDRATETSTLSSELDS